MAYASRKPSISYDTIGTSSYAADQRLALRPEDIYPAGVERRGPGGGLEEHISRPVPHKGWKYDYRTRRGIVNRDPLEDIKIYPSGFPLPAGTYRTKRRDAGAAFQRLARTSVRRERQDPDVEIAPSGFPEPLPEREFIAPTPQRSVQYLKETVKTEVAQQLGEYERTVEAPGAGEVSIQEDTWSETRAKLAEAEREKYRAIQKIREANELARLSNLANQEAAHARKLAEESRKAAQAHPNKTRNLLAEQKEALADAKIEIEERILDLAAVEKDVEKAEQDRRTKIAEAKVVAKNARSKRSEVLELERLVQRLETLKVEAKSAEERAAQLEKEVVEFTKNRMEKQTKADVISEELDKARRNLEMLAEKYSEALAESETSTAVVTRYNQRSEEFVRAAEAKRVEAARYAAEYKRVREEAEAAKAAEQKLWNEARSVGDTSSQRAGAQLSEMLAPAPEAQPARTREVRAAQAIPTPLVPPAPLTKVEHVRDFAEPKLTPRRLPDKDLEDEFEEKGGVVGVTTPQQVTPPLRTDKVRVGAGDGPPAPAGPVEVEDKSQGTGGMLNTLAHAVGLGSDDKK